MANEGPIIGIDLGMTSVIAAHVPAPGEPPRVIPAEKGHTSLASVVAFKDGGRPVVGRAARDMLTTAPGQTVTGIKRLLGRKANSQAVRDLAARVGFEIIAGPDGEAAVRVADRDIRVPEVAGILLDQARRFAEKELGEPVRQCVIAVPAYFNDGQKAAVKEAAELAGLKVKKLVHEPTAVALAYGYNKGGDARIVIVDMGGVRLDVSVMEISGNVFDVVATGGDPYLGGANIDARIAEWILANIKKKHGQDLRAEPRLLQKVRTAAEQAKRELSRCKAVDLQIPLEVGSRDKKAKLGLLRLHLSTVEELAGDIVKRVLDTVRRTLGDRGLKPADVDEVILVGGATRMPLLKGKVEKLFGREARQSLPPEEVVSLGAALLADSLRRERPAAQDVVERSIGIALADGRYMRIIDKDSKLPITRRVMIPTFRDNQRILELDVFEGEAEDILDADYLGSVVYQGIVDAKAGEAKVVVDMTLGPERVLKITSPETGRDQEAFEFAAFGHNTRKEDALLDPRFDVAKGRPTA
ncbi:MAG: Hsp70 family protein [Myxococcales bacterium]|nr:Hsp70 family protein [Myxococcales bacterium]